MKIQVSQLTNNPYRDMDLYPISPVKVAGLVESIKQTDFWENLLARPKGNEYNGIAGDDLVDYLKGLNDAPEDMEIELMYGHHRWYACVEANITEMDIPVKVIEDEIALKIMANENKGDWGSNMSVILETVRQVRSSIHARVCQYETFEDYAMENSFFKTQKTFSAAKDINNIGYRRQHEFLGETWSESDIRFADATLKAVDDGTIEQLQVVNMPSIGVMRQYINIAKAVRNTDWPDYFKDLYVDSTSKSICEDGTTVKIATRCATMVKKGNLPLPYLTKQKVVPFDLVKELKNVCEGVYDDSEKPQTLAPQELLDIEGLGDYEGMTEAVVALTESLKKAEERREAAGAAPPEGEEGTSVPEGGEIGESAQSAIDAAEKDADSIAEPSFPTNIEVPDGDAPVRDRLTMLMQTSQGVKFQIDQLRGKTSDAFDGDDNLAEQFGLAYDTLFIAAAQLGLEIYGKQYLVESIETAEETM